MKMQCSSFQTISGSTSLSDDDAPSTMCHAQFTLGLSAILFEVELVFSVLLLTERLQLNKASNTSHSPNIYAAMINKQRHFRTHFTLRSTVTTTCTSALTLNSFAFCPQGVLIGTV
jgi:hypothetical protein